jgi:hypothetical protein
MTSAVVGSTPRWSVVVLAAVATAGAAAADATPAAPWMERRAGREIVVRPLLGVGPTISDGGIGLEAEIGLRLNDALLRFSTAGGIGWGFHFYCDEHDPACGTPNELYVLRALHADYLALESERHVGFVGIGVGRIAFGAHPTDELFASRSVVLIPEAGVVLGHRNAFGRVVLDVQFLVPLSTAGPSLPTPGETPSRPAFLLSLAASL